ncbi:CpsD/CapB family tyrosine-protein kinase [Aeribacillus pallidus]|uniref:non-specific protein-tyrosine kinase n=1 Tax=Aeribacillus pallidus TaxID=33936 RepID=A0A223E2H8_9BACI|nr:CpsD/CapB family tyrosine-protein kinase [Aeribacillus pallidus]ASS89477.1 capsular biosynthesis protein [Aeribacillus pallidus]
MAPRTKGMKQKQRTLITALNPKSPISEQYRTIRTNIQFSSVDHEIRSIMITSTGPGEGKSTTAENLAVVFAQQGKQVLLIDADLRKPTVHYTFRLQNIHGLTSVLLRNATLQEAVSVSEVDHLDVLTSGPIPPNPAELLSSRSMVELLKEAYDQYDIVIIDSPPLLAVADAQILANQVDASIMVVASGKTEREAALKGKESLLSAKSKLLGVVLNGKPQKDSHYYYYYGGKN